jgi:hypothetical protein
MEDLIGKKILAFEFSGDPGINTAMIKLIGKEGIIHSYHPDGSACRVVFNNTESWSYPYPEILNHLVKEKTIEELLIEMKQLTSQVWKQKI